LRALTLPVRHLVCRGCARRFRRRCAKGAVPSSRAQRAQCRSWRTRGLRRRHALPARTRPAAICRSGFQTAMRQRPCCLAGAGCALFQTSRNARERSAGRRCSSSSAQRTALRGPFAFAARAPFPEHAASRRSTAVFCDPGRAFQGQPFRRPVSAGSRQGVLRPGGGPKSLASGLTNRRYENRAAVA
jgi:hypothetical protein